MANLNRTLLIGRLTRDPEHREFTSGSTVVNFGFAVNNRRKNSTTGQWEDEPVFIDCEAWIYAEGRGTGKVILDYCRKGHLVYLDGHLRLEQWQDKNDGSKRSRLKLVVDNVQLLQTKNDAGPANGHSQPSSPPKANAPRRPAPPQADWAGPNDQADGSPWVHDTDIPF